MRSMTASAETAAAAWRKKSRSMMKWAVDAHTRQPVYVSALARNQTGLQCECVCPHCGSVLQAVNAGVSLAEIAESDGLDQHFRHHRTRQRDRCKLAVADRAALELVLSQGLIRLPAPKVPRSVVGRSGASYSATSEGQEVALRFVSFKRVDETAAELVLEDGRRIALMLRGSRSIDPVGDWCAVVEIQVDDPEVALWDPKRILADARLVSDWSCVTRHWQDSELAREAEQRALEAARAALDDVEHELDFPDWLLPKQRSECVLHWQIKSILARARHMVVGRHLEAVTEQMPHGRAETRWLSLPATRLRLDDVRFEKPLQGFKPDIYCRATDPSGVLGTFDLAIEIAVTHPVGSDKLEKIRQRDIACIELYSERLSRGGVITVDELSRLVLDEPGCKRWLHHEQLEGQRQQAQQALSLVAVAMSTQQAQMEKDRKRAEEKAAEDQRRQEQASRARHAGFARLTDREAAREVLFALRLHWQRLPMRSTLGGEWEMAELKQALAARGLEGLLHPDLVEEYGPAWQLSCVFSGMRRPNGKSLPYSDLLHSCWDRRWLRLVHTAIDIYTPPLAQADVDFVGLDRPILEADRERLEQNIERGELTFVRPIKHDEALELLFPVLSVALEDPRGTPAYAGERARLVAQEKQEKQQAQLLEAAATLESQRMQEEAARQVEIEQQAMAEEARRAARLAESIDLLAHEETWRDPTKQPHDTKTAVAFASATLGQLNAEAAYAIGSAVKARESGATLRQWLESCCPQSEEAVVELNRLARAAFLIESKHKSRPQPRRR